MKASMLGVLVLAFCAGLGPPAGALSPDPPIRVLHISRAGSWYRTLDQDPAISAFWLPVPGHSHIELLGEDPAVLHRIMRIYMPRRVEDLLDEYNMIILHECPYGSLAYETLWFKDTWIQMFVEAVEEHGISLEMWGGDASFGGGGEGFYTSWGESSLGPLLPVECLGDYNYQFATTQRVEFVDTASPLARLPWNSAPPIELNNQVKLKDGAHAIADVVRAGVRWPYIFDWKYGEGFVVGETQVIHSRGTLNLMVAYWDYFPDFITYLVYYGAGRDIPDDVILAKRVRNQILTHFSERSLAISVIDFAEKFGADVGEAHAYMTEIDDAHAGVEALYLQEDYVGCSDALEQIQGMWRDLSELAVELKDRALFWVYLIEYFAVAGTSMIGGTVLWLLMVRRRLYKEIGVTRLDLPRE
jgi:hypothetical protein